MRIVLGISIVVLAVFGAVAAPSFVHGPYAGAPAETSIVISWLASEQTSARLEYAPLSEYETSGSFTSWVDRALQEVTAPVTEHVTLSGLDTNTSFVYRVILEGTDGDVASPVGHFVTEPPSGDIIYFAVVADTQWQWEGENRLEIVANAIAADDTPFDFVLHAGDIVESPSTPYWDHWFSSFDSTLQRAPFIPVLGNHERGHRTYYEYFNLPPGAGKNGEKWWALHWGDVVVVGLDTASSKVAEMIAQQDWLRQHLSGPEPHKFVMFHYPVYSSDAFHGSGYSYDIIYHPIFVETGVDVVFNGHAHNYERIQVDGVTYLVVGGGGAVPRALAETMVEGSIVAIEGQNFYLRVAASASNIDVDVVSIAQAGEETFEPTDGYLLDTFSLPEADTTYADTHWLLILVSLLGAALGGYLLLRALK